MVTAAPRVKVNRLSDGQRQGYQVSDNGLFHPDSFSYSHHHRVSNYCIIYCEMTRLFSQTTRYLPETKRC